MKHFSSLLFIFFDNFKHYVRFRWFGNLNSVELFIIQVDAILEVGFAHFATKNLPVYCNIVGILNALQPFSKPLS